jgi:hypothetical protein
LQDEHFVCLNHALMQQLGTIGQALYMRLFFHFANLYDGANTQSLNFQKRYADTEEVERQTARESALKTSRVRVPVERDQGFRWKMITQSGAT